MERPNLTKAILLIFGVVDEWFPPDGVDGIQDAEDCAAQIAGDLYDAGLLRVP